MRRPRAGPPENSFFFSVVFSGFIDWYRRYSFFKKRRDRVDICLYRFSRRPFIFRTFVLAHVCSDRFKRKDLYFYLWWLWKIFKLTMKVTLPGVWRLWQPPIHFFFVFFWTSFILFSSCGGHRGGDTRNDLLSRTKEKKSPFLSIPSFQSVCRLTLTE